MNDRRHKIYINNIEVMNLLCPNYKWAGDLDEPTCMLIRENNCVKVDFYPHTGRWKYTDKKGFQHVLSGGAALFVYWYREHKGSIK